MNILTCPSCFEGKFTLYQKLRLSEINPLYCNCCRQKVKKHLVAYFISNGLFQLTFIGLIFWNIFNFSLISLTLSIVLFGLTVLLMEVGTPLVVDKNNNKNNNFFYLLCVLITLLFFVGLFQTIFGHEFAPMVVLSVIFSIFLTSAGYSKIIQAKRERKPFRHLKLFTIIAVIPFTCFLVFLIVLLFYSLFDSQPLIDYLTKIFPSLRL